YNLVQDSDVTIRIYTLLGELVRTLTFDETQIQGLAGVHSGDIEWDGTNDKGQKVLNGVYVAVLITKQGKATTKIAIAK
ncbi:MAG: FlgD immunoglobulin-like domain containing protein, partial [bacterium]